MSTSQYGGCCFLIMTTGTELEITGLACGIFGFGLPCLNADDGIELGLGTNELRGEFPS